MPREYQRKFDWDEARARHAAGETPGRIAAELGVTEQAIRRVVIPGERERVAEYGRAHTVGAGACDDCGGPMNLASRYNGSTRCRACSAVARATTVRPGALQCCRCHEWKPDDDFPSNRSEKVARRGRHGVCRPCQTIARREYRQRNRERDNAYNRQYKQRQRSQAA